MSEYRNPAEEMLLGYRKMERESEKRTRRVQLVLPPSLYERIRNVAYKDADIHSFNEAAIQAFEEWLEKKENR